MNCKFTILSIVFFCLSFLCYSQGNSNVSSLYIKDNSVSISPNKTKYGWCILPLQPNKYLSLKIFSEDSINIAEIESLKFRLVDSEFKKVRSQYLSGHHDGRRRCKNNTMIITFDYVIRQSHIKIKYPLRKRIYYKYGSTRMSKNLSTGTYFLIINNKHGFTDTVTIKVKPKFIIFD